MTFRRSLTTAVTVCAFMVAGCGGTDSSPAGNDSGDLRGTSITVYSGRSEELVGDLFEKFTAETGISVEARYGDSGEMAATILTEGSASPADVFFSQDAGALGAIEDMFAPLPDDVLSAVNARFAAESGKWVGISGRVRVVVYNPTLVSTPPNTIDELLDPKWSGKIGFAPTNASWQSFVTALRVLRGESAAETWLRGFAANKPQAYEKNSAVRDAVNDGDVALGLVNHYYLLEKIAAEGASNVVARNQFMAPGDPGGLINVAGVGILNSSSNPRGAAALVTFLQSDVAAEYFRTRTWEYILTNDATQARELPSLEDLQAPSIDLSSLKSLQQTQELLQKVDLLTK